MNKQKHTPGPWRLSNYHNPYRYIVRDGGSDDNDAFAVQEGRLICEVAASKRPTISEFKANACLIAAAPDLLSVCKAILAANESDGFDFDGVALYPEIKGQLKAAIEKAEGGK